MLLSVPRYIKAPIVGAFLFCILLSGLSLARSVDTPIQFSAQVVRAIDGDTLLLQDQRLVRLIGINAPELGKDGAADEPLARDAQALLQSLTARKTVTLSLENEHKDRYGRLLARVILANGHDVQQLLLSRGLACVIAVPPNLAQLAANQAVEARARGAGTGLWRHPHFAVRAAGELNKQAQGFHFVQGRVERVGRSRRYHYFDLSAGFTLMVAREDWLYFDGKPEAWLHKEVEARGWLNYEDKKLRLRVRHPAMVKITNPA